MGTKDSTGFQWGCTATVMQCGNIPADSRNASARTPSCTSLSEVNICTPPARRIEHPPRQGLGAEFVLGAQHLRFQRGSYGRRSAICLGEGRCLRVIIGGNDAEEDLRESDDAREHEDLTDQFQHSGSGLPVRCPAFGLCT
jgi:hypothetical protein